MFSECVQNCSEHAAFQKDSDPDHEIGGNHHEEAENDGQRDGESTEQTDEISGSFNLLAFVNDVAPKKDPA